MTRKLLFNAGIVTMDGERRQYNDGAILLDRERIVRIAPSAELLAESSAEVERIDLRGCWILPGLINTHVHTSQHLGVVAENLIRLRFDSIVTPDTIG